MLKETRKHGRDILETEVTNISSHGLWILSNEKEFWRRSSLLGKFRCRFEFRDDRTSQKISTSIKYIITLLNY